MEVQKNMKQIIIQVQIFNVVVRPKFWEEGFLKRKCLIGFFFTKNIALLFYDFKAKNW